MRLQITADLHFNHAVSRPLAVDLIERMNSDPADGVLVVGDTATADGEALEQCLSRFRVAGPKLFVAGNHELWTRRDDSYVIYHDELPRRVRAVGWHWLEDEPFVGEGFAIVGSVGWYDYSMAPAALGVPRRFYQAKVSPGAAVRFSEFAHLFEEDEDISHEGRQALARWNDAQFVKLRRSDEQFLEELLVQLESQLTMLRHVPRVLAAVHHLPFRELLPPPRNPSWDFAQAFLGSGKIGQLLLRYENVRSLFCGHSHYACSAQVGHILATNVGSGYRSKQYHVVDL